VIRVAIVDDQPVVRAGVARILGPEDGLEVVAGLDDGDQVLPAGTELRPDLVLLDVRMRRVGGPEAVRILHRDVEDPPPVLMFTTFDDDDALWGALDGGAAGFILKDCAAEDLIAACRAVAAGGAWLDPQVTPRVMGAFRRQVVPRRRARARADHLTDRELDVLRHMARGATNTEIASRLVVGEATVKSHVGSIFSKLGARDRAAAIVYAYDHGLVAPGSEPGEGPDRPRHA
jgi:DNA-binding NarL/FixJ family response regulator